MKTALILVFVCLQIPAQTARRTPDLAGILAFDAAKAGEWPPGWGGGPPGTAFGDDTVKHGGRGSARLERTAGSAGPISTLTIGIPMDFSGRSIQFKGFLKVQDVAGSFGLWMREDGESSPVAFDNMEGRRLTGSSDWAEYSITLPVQKDGRKVYFGVLLAGSGKAWVNDLQLLVDGKPIWEAPAAPIPITVLDTDLEFKAGSRVAFTQLSAIQIDNLQTLGKVWGYLKYHHPQITAGKRHWDYDLFRILPTILAAPDHAAANAALLQWVEALGAPAACSPCAPPAPADLYLRPATGWISDTKLLGSELSQKLRAIDGNRPAKQQFYVSLNPGVLNPNFEHESPYNTVRLPDAGFQLLALYRFWNIIEYWFPYRDVIGDDWDKVLVEFIPRVALAKTSAAYQLELIALIARVHDTHANLWSSLNVRPPVGNCQMAVEIRFVGESPVVAGYLNEAATTSGLKFGDVLSEIDGAPVAKLIERWLPYYAASNRTTQLRDIARSMTNGECGTASLQVQRAGKAVDVTTARVPSAGVKLLGTHDLPGDTFRRLSPEIAYLKLSSVKLEDAARYIDNASGAKGLILDIRNYPSAFMVFALGQRLVDAETQFAGFTRPDLSYPGAFAWTPPVALKPATPRFAGKVMILVDEISQSQAEYTAMAFRTAPDAKVIGSTTAGADGNVSQIPLPGGLRTMISGLGVFYPDKRPTQRVGILPDIEVKPTIEGIRAGRDEVLEAAIRQILGADVPAARIEKLYKP